VEECCALSNHHSATFQVTGEKYGTKLAVLPVVYNSKPTFIQSRKTFATSFLISHLNRSFNQFQGRHLVVAAPLRP
jgi:hypothetical protein